MERPPLVEFGGQAYDTTGEAQDGRSYFDVALSGNKRIIPLAPSRKLGMARDGRGSENSSQVSGGRGSFEG